MALCISPCGKYRLERLTPATVSGAMTVMKEGYIPDEYVSKANEFDKDPEATEQYLAFVADFMLQGLSVVAVEISSGEVVSVCINRVQTESLEASIAKASAEEKHALRPSTKSLLKFSLELENHISLFEKSQPDSLFEMIFVGTLSAHRGKKLGYLCCKASVDIAKKLKDEPIATITVQDLGPKYSELKPSVNLEDVKPVPKICQMICSSIATQKIGKALGFTVHIRISMAEFSYNGKNYVERNGFDPYLEVQAVDLD